MSHDCLTLSCGTRKFSISSHVPSWALTDETRDAAHLYTQLTYALLPLRGFKVYFLRTWSAAL